jgi:oligopeptidase B
MLENVIGLPSEEWQIKEHGILRKDEYHWLKNRNDPRVISWLEANNRHTREAMSHTADLQENIFKELLRITPPDEGQAVDRNFDFPLLSAG